MKKIILVMVVAILAACSDEQPRSHYTNGQAYDNHSTGGDVHHYHHDNGGIDAGDILMLHAVGALGNNGGGHTTVNKTVVNKTIVKNPSKKDGVNAITTKPVAEPTTQAKKPVIASKKPYTAPKKKTSLFSTTKKKSSWSSSKKSSWGSSSKSWSSRSSRRR